MQEFSLPPLKVNVMYVTEGFLGLLVEKWDKYNIFFLKACFLILKGNTNKSTNVHDSLCLALSKVVTYSGVGGWCPRVSIVIHRVASGQTKVPLGFFGLLTEVKKNVLKG